MSEDTPMNEPSDAVEPSRAAEAGRAPGTASGAAWIPPAPAAQENPWHPVHIAHLVMGLAFLGLVTVWALVVPLNAVELPHARWLLPLPWLVAGAAGLVATVLSGRRRP